MLSIYKTVEDLNAKVAQIIDLEAKKKGIDGFGYFCTKECSEMLQDIYHSNLNISKEEVASFMGLNVNDVLDIEYSCPTMWVQVDSKHKQGKFVLMNEEVYEHALIFRERKQLAEDLEYNLTVKNNLPKTKQFKM